MNGATSARSLTRGLGLVACLGIVVNGVVGTGIFLKAPAVLCDAGSPMWALAAWALAGLLSLAGALTYAELAAMMPRAGGEYVFLCTAFGPLWGFLYGWMRYFVANAGGQAALVIAFTTFLNLLMGGALDVVFFSVTLFGHAFDFGGKQIAVLAVLGVATLVNLATVAVNGRLAAALAAVKIALVLAIGIGAIAIAPGDWGHFSASVAGICPADPAQAAVPGALRGAAGFGAALLGALWAYNGWYSLTLLGGEVERPGQTIPLALGGGMLIVVALSLLVNVGYVHALAPSEIAALGADSPVAVVAAGRFLGSTGVALVVAGLCVATFGALQVALLANARVGYAMAVDGLFFAKAAKLSKRRVPTSSLLGQAQWTAVLALSASLETLTNSMIFASLLFYGLGAIACLVLRRTKPDAERPYRVLGYPYVPIAFMVGAALILVDTVVLSPGRSLLGLGLIAIGLPAYWFWSRRGGPEVDDDAHEDA